MANQKITELVSLKHDEVQNQDLLVIVDRDDLSSPTGRTKNIEAVELASYIIGTETLVSSSKQISFKDLFDVTGSISPGYNVVVSSSGTHITYQPNTFVNLTDTPNDYSGYNNYLVRVNAAGNALEFIPSGSIIPNSNSISQTFTQPGHIFKLGDAVYRNSGNTWVEANAANEITSEVAGVISAVNGSSFTVSYGGIINGFSGLIPGQVHFLTNSTNIGLPVMRNLDTNPPAPPSYNKPVLLAITSTEALVLTYRALAVTNATGSGAGGGTGTNKATISIPNSFTNGNVIYRTSTGYLLARADTEASSEVFGVVESADALSFTSVYSGEIIIPSHSFTNGDVVYLSQTTFGALTAIRPTSGIEKPVGIVKDGNTIVINSWRGMNLDTTISGSFGSGGGGAGSVTVTGSIDLYDVWLYT
jgi:hypothetical protein